MHQGVSRGAGAPPNRNRRRRDANRGSATRAAQAATSSPTPSFTPSYLHSDFGREPCAHSAGTERATSASTPFPIPRSNIPRDAIIKITACAICGSDLHLLDGYQPTMESGDILGHENMGEVIELGSEVTNLRIGDRVVVPFTISCGQCWFCKKGLFSCCDTTNPNAEMAIKAMGHSPAGLFGFSHMLGGYSGGQAEYLRVPMADVGPIKVPDSVTDEQALFLSDIFPTGYMAAENAQIQDGDTVAIWGCGPGRPVRHPLGADDGRRPGDRDRRGARAAGDGRGGRRRDDRFLEDRRLRRADGAHGQARAGQLYRRGRLRGLGPWRGRRGPGQGQGA